MPRKVAFSLIGLTLLAALVLVWLLENRPATAVRPLRLAVTKNPLSLLAYIAQEQGYFERHGIALTLREYLSGAETAAALVGGETDVSASSEYVLVRRNLEGAGLKTFAAITRVQDCELVARRDRGIASPEGLRGKRVGTLPGTVLDVFARDFLDVHGVPLSSITLINYEPSTILRAFEQGAVDAIFCFSPISYMAKNRLGGQAIAWPVQQGQNYYFLLLAHPAFLQERRETALALLRALLNAEQFVSDHRAEARQVLVSRLGLTPEEAAIAWDQQRYGVRLDQHLVWLMEDEARLILSPSDPMPNYLAAIDWTLLESISPDDVGIFR